MEIAMTLRPLTIVLALAALWQPGRAMAETRWVKARLGSFEAISDDGRKPATQALSQFAQFSFALGTVLGKPDLRLDPPLRIIVFKNAQELQAQCNPPLRTGRDRLMACTVAEGQLPHSLLRDLTRTLLASNFSSLPPGIEKALETFFSTVESNAVHVTWGTPPPVAERTRDWAMLHRIITQPDDGGKAGIYLHNLSAGLDPNAASRNAFGEDGAKFDAEIDRYYAAGVFTPVPAPSRPLNPDRDISSTVLTSDEGELMHADLLTSESAAKYQSLLKAGKHTAEANEGLAILAMRGHDDEAAKRYMEAARQEGTKNVVALTEYARLQTDSIEAILILKDALTIDPKYAPAHWAFGEKLNDDARRMMEWKQAVNLAPGNYEWAAQYAQLCVDQKQYAEAGRAWLAAAQAAPNAQLREQYLSARGRIDEQRLAAEDEERRKEIAAKDKEINRLKAEARQELSDLEARTNTRPLSKDEVANAVPYFDANAPNSLTGTLTRVDCAGKQLRLSVKGDDGITKVLLVPDSSRFLTIGDTGTLPCGVQKARRVRVAYKPLTNPPNAKTAPVSGEATGMEFEP
jgi:hypothetical protein